MCVCVVYIYVLNQPHAWNNSRVDLEKHSVGKYRVEEVQRVEKVGCSIEPRTSEIMMKERRKWCRIISLRCGCVFREHIQQHPNWWNWSRTTAKNNFRIQRTIFELFRWNWTLATNQSRSNVSPSCCDSAQQQRRLMNRRSLLRTKRLSRATINAFRRHHHRRRHRASIPLDIDCLAVNRRLFILAALNLPINLFKSFLLSRMQGWAGLTLPPLSVDNF